MSRTTPVRHSYYRKRAPLGTWLTCRFGTRVHMAPFRFPRVKHSLFAPEGCAHVTHTTEPLLRSLLQQNPAPAHSPSLLPIFPPRVDILSRTGRPNRCACARPFPLASTSGVGGGAGFSRPVFAPKTLEDLVPPHHARCRMYGQASARYLLARYIKKKKGGARAPKRLSAPPPTPEVAHLVAHVTRPVP